MSKPTQIDIRSITSPRRLLLAILTLAVVTRTYVCFYVADSWWVNDSKAYYEQAAAILEGHPISGFPNGYPLLISGLKVLFGEHAPLANILFNIVAATSIVWLVYELGRDLAGSLTGLVAALGVTLYPTQIHYTRRLLSELPATLLLLTSFFLLANRRDFLAGLFVAAASWIRPSLLPVAGLVIAASLLVRDISIMRRKRYLFGASTCFLISFGLLGVGVVKSSNNVGKNLLISIQSNSYSKIQYERESFTSKEKRSPLMTYIDFARSNPREYLQQRWSSIRTMWGPWPPARSHEGTRPAYERVLIGLRFPLLILSLLGLFVMRNRAAAWILASPILVVSFVHAFFFSTVRFTFPAEPSAMILAAVFLVRFVPYSCGRGSSDKLDLDRSA
jgi:4-amino-4-deoxy-L-arabinose transferase-like glycosyltransferase